MGPLENLTQIGHGVNLLHYWPQANSLIRVISRGDKGSRSAIVSFVTLPVLQSTRKFLTMS